MRIEFEHFRHGWIQGEVVRVFAAGYRLTDAELVEYADLDSDLMDERVQRMCKSVRGPSKRDRVVVRYWSPVSGRPVFLIMPVGEMR